ncbi:MAG: hypothetical protein JO252_23345 [Planctomycetaceae bacterium]|nr:hypothetical protein [Planctomycetaceae bacterium]MBV8554650.1 hypothetical protein [Planctomycetaceae bacterium]MBV8609548.1 hypothetical protein [Singulisphaera sp.]
MLSRAGQVKPIDFGTAWIRGQEKDRLQRAPQDMAPEQASKQMVDRRIDLYNFGVTMARRFTGRHAQQGILIPDEVSSWSPRSRSSGRFPGR